MDKLCCLLKTGWKCTLCNWKQCEDCLQDRAEKDFSIVTVDDVHTRDQNCVGILWRG